MAESTVESVEAVTYAPKVSTGVDGTWDISSSTYRGAIFGSATLLFLVEPMVAKRLLPDFGGAASVWATCLMFFQCVLLLGYTYSHVLTGYLSRRLQAAVHVTVIIAGAAVTLLDRPVATHATGTPAWDCLLTLCRTVGVPFFALSATTPLLQVWFKAKHHTGLPYRFFALSNIGSLLALLAYPMFFERVLDLRDQFAIWKGLFCVFAVIMVWIAVGISKGSQECIRAKADDGSKRTPTRIELAAWITIAACSSALLLSVTNMLCQQVAPLPLLWVVPLAVYLASFAIAFDWESLLSRSIFQWSVPAALVILPWSLAPGNASLSLAITASMTALFVICLFCHAQLSWLKPAVGSPTSFYLCVALGGALGSIFVAMVAPAIFPRFLEFPIALAGAVALTLSFLFEYRSKIFAALCGVTYICLLQIPDLGTAHFATMNARNFYGMVSVREYATPAREKVRSLIHGAVLHGSQFLSAKKQTEPLSYYGRDSGIGLLLSSRSNPQEVGVIGLGAGTLATYGRREDSYVFYEINPLVVGIAQNQFTYLKNSAARISIELGDARLSLKKEPNRHFDILVVDAFSGDAIPVHLLTREAFALYLSHLSPKGMVAIHVSNNYLELKPVVAGIAAAAGKQAWLVHSKADQRKLTSEAEWVVIPSAGSIQLGDATPLPLANRKLWTDQYNSVLSILKY